MTSHRLITMIYSLLTTILCTIPINCNTEAQINVGQVSQNRLESIANETHVLTSAQINVGDEPSSITAPQFDNSIYVANSGSDTVSVIDPVTNTVTQNIKVGNGPRFMVSYTNISTIYLGNYSSIAYGVPTIYVANSWSGTVSVIDPQNNTVIENITVEGQPTFIETYGDTIYVANSGSDTVSVIDPATNIVIENITVGDQPTFIETYGDTIYVANSGSDTVSVIDPATNTVIKNITVGGQPTFIETYGDTIYVANSGSDTVSVIDPATNIVIENLTVGDDPSFVGVYGWEYIMEDDTFEGTVYVANFESDTVSVIDHSTNEVVAGVTLGINPFSGGQIICDGLDAPINRYFYVSSGTECVAKPNNGYEFASWVETFDGNSSRTIIASTTSHWLVDPLGAFRDVFTDDPAANLTVNRFGNFTAYFRALPPPVPAEFTISLITVVITALVGSLLIPAAVGWARSKKQTSRLNSFHLKMALYK